MQLRSWMATLVLTGGSTVLLADSGWAQQPGRDPQATKAEAPEQPQAKGDAGAANKPAQAPGAQPVELNLLIAGLRRDGCDVEVKPGNRSTRFQPQSLHIGASGKASFVFRDVEVRGADRNCSFAITMREPGQAPKTIFRGFRITARVAPGTSPTAAQSFTCYMNSPSKLAGLERPDRTRQ
jgi:hypothetical protein